MAEIQDIFKDLTTDDPLFAIKMKANIEHRERIARIKKEWAEKPELKEQFLKELRERNIPKGSPKAPVENVVEFQLSDFKDDALMAHAMAKAGLFPSVSQARKNGWDKPIQTGSWVVGKRKKKVVIK